MNIHDFDCIQYHPDFPDEIDNGSCSRIRGYQIARGATKTCYINEKEKIVIKFDSRASKDYCQKEVDNYQGAIKYGVERILLETKFLCINANGVPLYIQPLLDETMYNRSNITSKQIRKQIVTIKRNTVYKYQKKIFESRLNDQWVRQVLSLYGKRFMKSFTEWTQEYEVNDLHDGNIGYQKHKPVIFDYSGYVRSWS